MSSTQGDTSGVTTYKAQVAALIAFLGPLATFVAVEGAWDWRAFVGALIAAVIAGLSTYAVPYHTTPRSTRRTRGAHNV